jgi:hypothetical protein
MPKGGTWNGIFKRNAASRTSGVDSSANFSGNGAFFTNPLCAAF